MLKRSFLGLALLSCGTMLSAQDSGGASGDRHYVTDELRLSMYSNANDKSQVLKLLQSGDSVDIEQIQGNDFFLVLRYAVWGPDGDIAYSDGARLYVLDAEGGPPRQLRVPADWKQVDVHDWSPDGRWLGVVGGSFAQPELWTIHNLLGTSGADASRR